jgi:WhiB family transcriptional regulator, redox-sensing transcriptional regulator
MHVALTTIDPSPAPWMTAGACRTEDPELFFPLSATAASRPQIRRATTICHRCDVEAECLRYALLNGIKHGIWGGRTEDERSVMIRARSRTGPRRGR